MDNDNRIIKFVANIYKNIRFRSSYFGKTILSDTDGNELIYQMILSGEPCMIARLGATESRCVEKWMRKKVFEETNIQNIKQLSGVFPNDEETIKAFCVKYTKAMSDMDVLSVWGVTAERAIIELYSPLVKLIGIMSLEPYFYRKPWSYALKGKKVLVVHPFVETIELQMKNKDCLFDDNKVLPDFQSVSYVKAVQSLEGTDEYESWFAALEGMCKQIECVDFDVAIIGAGAYGLPLSSFVKSIGKQAIQIAGASQILFGIKGKRWEERPKYQKLFNEFWVRPSNTETPKHKEKVEGGSYW